VNRLLNLNHQTYNTAFSYQEFTTAIEKSSDSAVGPDENNRTVYDKRTGHSQNIA